MSFLNDDPFRYEPWNINYPFVSHATASKGAPVSALAGVAVQCLKSGIELDTCGYSLDALENVMWTFGYYDVDRRLSFRQAEELAVIGRNLLALWRSNPAITYTFVWDEADERQMPLFNDRTIRQISSFVGVVDKAIAELDAESKRIET